MMVYLDNASTSYPKPKCVEEALLDALNTNRGSLHRSHSFDALELERMIYDTRCSVAAFFNFSAIDHVVFTKNITESINLLQLVFLKPKDHVVITCLEHNAVLRPLEYLRQTREVTYTIVPLDGSGSLDLASLETALSLKPKLMLCTCASNVTGDLVDVEKVGELCQKYAVPFAVDTAQMAGVMPIDIKKIGADFLAFTGHKTLLGPQGIGGLLINPLYAKDISPLIFGGTGSVSESFEQPFLMPDRFESGTANTLGILGLKAALFHHENLLKGTVRSHELKLIMAFQEGLNDIGGVKLVGQKDPYKRVGIVALDFETIDPSEAAHTLDQVYHISTRVGLHCAPLAHQAYGTYPKGLVRFSVSPYNTLKEIDYVLGALRKLVKQ